MMNKKWLWIAGSIALLVPVITFTACKVSMPGDLSGVSPIEVQVNNQQEGIWANGEGKVTVTPDIATVSLGIEAQAATVSEAQSDAASAMDMVMNALTTSGVAEKDIQTQYFNISQITRWDDKSQEEVVIGYRVTNTVTAKIRDVTKAGAVIDAVALAGGDLTRVNYISFSVDDPSRYYQEARDKAMDDARNKAEQLATLAGVELGKPTYISESAYYPPVPVYRDVAYEAAAPTTPISPGEMEITLNLQVVYDIID
jgi:uncharacterized protein YggE